MDAIYFFMMLTAFGFAVSFVLSLYIYKLLIELMIEHERLERRANRELNDLNFSIQVLRNELANLKRKR